MEAFLEDYGLVVLFAILAVQTAGIAGPPGKTALVAASILAADGHFPITGVLVVATLGVVVGGAVGYAVGRTGGRRLLNRPAVARRVGRPLALTERLFRVHGPKAVFLGRFIPGVKVAAAPTAGIVGMPAAVFALWHALGAVAFSLVFGLTAFFAGEAAIELLERYGTYALVPLAVVAVASAVATTLLRRRRRLRAAAGP